MAMTAITPDSSASSRHTRMSDISFPVRLGLAGMIMVLSILVSLVLGVILAVATELFYFDLWLHTVTSWRMLLTWAGLGILIGLSVAGCIVITQRIHQVAFAVGMGLLALIIYLIYNLQWGVNREMVAYAVAMAVPLAAMILIDRMIGGWRGLGLALFCAYTMTMAMMVMIFIAMWGLPEVRTMDDLITIFAFNAYQWSYAVKLVVIYGLLRGAEWAGMWYAKSG